MNRDLKPIFKKEWRIPFLNRIETALTNFSRTEKLIFFLFTIVLAGSTLVLLSKINEEFQVEVPAHGGSLSEGIIGSPRFANPLLALSDADRDLTALIYSGLLRAQNGELVPDLAQSYTISTDGLVYDFNLREDIYFHDGKKITADDVIFTIERAQDPTIKSPKRANWDGVRAEKISDRKIELTLKQSYAPFLENATLGILPKHIWQNIKSEEFPFSPYNVEPIGSGPYKIATVKQNSSGAPTYYELKSFDQGVLGEPFIDKIKLHFYGNLDELKNAYARGEIQAVSSLAPADTAELAGKSAVIERTPLPRIFGVFFNQNQAKVLANKEVRQALNLVTDKQAIVDKVLSGYGITIDGPIPPGLVEGQTLRAATTATTTETKLEAATNILTKAGWVKNPETGIFEKSVKKDKTDKQVLAFSLSTSNVNELKIAAELLKSDWEKLGAKIDLKIFETGDLNQNVIRPRKYDALLFGEIVGRDLDLFAFWHSSQRNDPGLNIALYTNIKADKALETARTESDLADRMAAYRQFEEEISRDIPAIFTYSPDFIYLLPQQIKGVELSHLTVPSERFLGINRWYIETNKVWKFFSSPEWEIPWF